MIAMCNSETDMAKLIGEKVRSTIDHLDRVFQTAIRQELLARSVGMEWNAYCKLDKLPRLPTSSTIQASAL